MRRAAAALVHLQAALLLALAAPALAQDARTLDVEGGGRVTYLLRNFPADAHVAKPGENLAQSSALDTAKLLNLHLSTGDIEEAAMLSNAPRRRFEILRDYRDAIGAEEFKKVFASYLAPENRLVAEIAIERHRLLIWELKQAKSQLAGQYFVEVDGKYLVDDVPNDKRTSLRWVLEAYRAGKLPVRPSN